MTTKRPDSLTKLFEEAKLSPRVGSILLFEETRTARYMLAGGKIILQVAA